MEKRIQEIILNLNLSYRPLVYFWIAHYNNNTAFPQFNPDTGKENKFKEIDFNRLTRFGWYPFSVELATKIYNGSNLIVIPTFNPSYFIDLKAGEKLIAKRTNHIHWRSRTGFERGEIIYILGKENNKVMRIKENGSIEVKV